MKKVSPYFTFPLSFFFVFASSALAHGTPFFEFNPDSFTTSSLPVLTSEQPVQEIFIPQNDYLNGVDFWFSNANTVSTASLELHNPSGSLLASRTITIPAIPDISGGQKVHTDFSGQFSVTSTSKYSITITTSNPALKLWYAPRVKVVQHNEPVLSGYQNGAAKLGTEEKNFSFKFALYEVSETSPPILSNLSTAILSPTDVRIDFNSNEPVDYRIDYGLSAQGYTQISDFTDAFTFCASGLDICHRQLSVSAGTTYYFQLTTKDAWGNQSTATGEFTTPIEGITTPTPTPTITPTPSTSTSATPTPSADTSPPVISQLRIVSTTPNGVQVAWQTDEAANSAYLISSLPVFLTVAAGSDGTMELEHYIESANVLSAGANYQIRVTSRDSANNTASQSLVFTMPTSTPIPANPTPQATPTTSTTVQPSQAPNSGNVALTWTSDTESNGYRVDIFDGNNNLIRTVTLPTGSTSTEINDLPTGTHTAIIYSSSSGAFKKIAPPVSIKVDRRSFWEKAFAPKNLAVGAAFLLLVLVITIIILKKRQDNLKSPPNTPNG